MSEKHTSLLTDNSLSAAHHHFVLLSVHLTLCSFGDDEI